MKKLIWFLTFLIGSIINTLIGIFTGIKAGAVLLFIVEYFVAKNLCEIWDEKHNLYYTQKSVDNIGTNNRASSTSFSNSLSNDEKLEYVYNNLNKKTANSLFPNGKSHFANVINSISKINRINLDSSEKKTYNVILEIYSEVYTKIFCFKGQYELIINSIEKKYQSIIKDELSAAKTLAFIMINIKNNDFSIDSEDSISIVNGLAESIIEEKLVRRENESHQNENLDDKDYGLTPQKPIYTNGVDGSKDYLSRLITLSGEKLSWKRIESIMKNDGKNIIDVYEGFLPSGDKYKTLYLNMYGTENSTTAPKGFIYKGNNKGNTTTDNATNIKSDSNTLIKPVFCRKCGYKLISDSLYCSKCGTKIEVIE